MDLLIALVIATIIIAGVYVGYHASQEPRTDVLPDSHKTPKKSADQSTLHGYQINTECELIYGFTTGKYPDGKNLPRIKMAELVGKYSKEFAPWQTILENNETRAKFFKEPLPIEFSDMLVITLMKESSIKPELKPIAELIMDPQGNQKLQQDFQQYNCQSYFEKKTNQPLN